MNRKIISSRLQTIILIYACRSRYAYDGYTFVVDKNLVLTYSVALLTALISVRN